MSIDKYDDRARDAASVLQSPVFAEAFARLDADLIARWRAASTPAEREDIFYRQHALRSVRDELLEHINAAAAADAKQGKQSPWRGLWEKLRNQRNIGST